MAGSIDDETKFIIVNSNHTVGRQNFTIAHELYHLFYDHTFKHIVCDRGDGKKNRVESSYKCSRSALLHRLRDLKLIDQTKSEQLKENVIPEVTLLGFDPSLYQKGNSGKIIGDYRILVKKLYDDEYISESSFLNFLRDIGVEDSDIYANL